MISIPAPYLPPDGGLPTSGTALAVAAARSSGSLTPESPRAPEGHDRRVAPCGQVTSPVSRQTASSASSAICATDALASTWGDRGRPPGWRPARLLLPPRRAPSGPAHSASGVVTSTPAADPGAQPGAAHSHLRGCGRGPRAVPDPSLSTGQTDHPADGTGGSDRAEGVVAVSRWRSPAAVHTGSAHGGLRPPGRVRLPGGSGIPLADAPRRATGHPVRPPASAEPGEDGLPGRLGSGSCAGADVQVDGGVLGDDGLAGRALVDDLVLVGLARRGRGDGAQGEPVGLEGGGGLGE